MQGGYEENATIYATNSKNENRNKHKDVYQIIFSVHKLFKKKVREKVYWELFVSKTHKYSIEIEKKNPRKMPMCITVAC
jgi:hypothetical protein